MKVLVFAHHLELGGTQTNAIELSARLVGRHGHDVVLFATPGPAAALAEERGLRLIEAPPATSHPSLARMRALRSAVRAERPDVVHAWDWPQCLDAFYGIGPDRRTPLACSSMAMVVSRNLPKVIPTSFGTPALHAEALAQRPDTAFLLEPPVDLDVNRPGVVDGAAFRRQHQVADDELLVVSVSRLTEWMKLESLQRLVRVAGLLAADHRLRVVIIGEGPSAPRLAQQAAAVNEAVGRTVVSVPGAMVDPRPAYEAADVVVGMGGSGLRAMAFAKPLLVVGEEGFSELFDRSHGDWFVWNGIYGIGDGDDRAATARMGEQLGGLLGSPDQRREAGAYAHGVVTSRYGLDTGADQVDRLLRRTMQRPPGPLAVAAEVARVSALRWGPSVVPRPVVDRVTRRLRARR